jgi:hypothetical protein
VEPGVRAGERPEPPGEGGLLGRIRGVREELLELIDHEQVRPIGGCAREDRLERGERGGAGPHRLDDPGARARRLQAADVGHDTREDDGRLAGARRAVDDEEARPSVVDEGLHVAEGLLALGIAAEEEAAVLGLEGAEAPVRAEDDGAGIVAVGRAGVELEARPVEVLREAGEAGASEGEGAPQRMQVDEQRLIEDLGEDLRALDRERIAGSDDRLDAGAMQRLGDAAEMVAGVAVVAAIAGGEHDEAQRVGVGGEELAEAPAVDDARRALTVEHQAVGRTSATAMAEQMEHGEGLARRLGAGQGPGEALRGGMGEHVGAESKPMWPASHASLMAR